MISDGVYTFIKYNYPEDGINWVYPGKSAFNFQNLSSFSNLALTVGRGAIRFLQMCSQQVQFSDGRVVSAINETLFSREVALSIAIWLCVISAFQMMYSLI